MSSWPISNLFLDIGGVLLTNEWDRSMRCSAAQKFDLDFEDFDDRKMFVEAAEEIGLHGVYHTEYEKTRMPHSTNC